MITVACEFPNLEITRMKSSYVNWKKEVGRITVDEALGSESGNLEGLPQ